MNSRVAAECLPLLPPQSVALFDLSNTRRGWRQSLPSFRNNWVVTCLRRVLWRYPALYRQIGIHRHRIDIDTDFDIFVAGYPRSANTFTVAFLRFSQGDRFTIGSHWHLPPVIIRALKHHKPVFFLLRQPAECAASFAVLCKSNFMDELRYYRDFHRVLRPFRDQLFIARFEDVVTRLPDLLRRFDSESDLGLRHDYPVEHVCRHVQEFIQRQSSRPDGRLVGRFYNLPLPERNRFKSEVRAQVPGFERTRLFRQAQDEFDYFSETAMRP